MTPIIFSTHLKKFLVICLLSVFLPLLIGCDGTPKEVSEAPIPQIFVVPVSTEKRLISEEQIPLNNCDGNFEITQTIERKHSILYTLQLENGVSVNVEGKAKIPEFGEVGVGGAVAAKYQVGYGREESLSRSVTVGAEGGSNIQHTIRQYEIWETGNVLIVLGEKSEEIPYSFRRDFSIEPLEPINLGCLPTKQTITPPATSNGVADGFRLCNKDAASSTFIQTNSSTGITRIEMLPSTQVFFISTNPATITFSPNSGLPSISPNDETQYVILGKDVPGLEWIELDPGFSYTACIYSSDQFARAKSEADRDMNNKKAQNNVSEYYFIDGKNIELVESFP